MSDWIVVDVEIQKTIEELPHGWDDTHLMGVSCAVVYEFSKDRYRVYGPDDVEALQQRIMAADRVSGYNIWKFDFPVIWGLPSRERVSDLLPKTDDLLRRIWMSLHLDPENFSKLHGGHSLDTIAGDTINQRKNGNGAHAPMLFQAGKWGPLVDYCINDVKIERDLAVFIENNGYVVKGSRVLNIEKWDGGK